MKLTIVHHYTATHLPPRCRKFRDLYLYDEFQVEILEISSAEAPVAVRYQLENPDPENERPGSGVVELRYHGGKLWELSSKSTEKLAETLGSRPHHGSISRAEALEMPSIGSFNDTVPRGDVERAIANAAARYLIIDGTLHKYAEEPYWQVTRQWRYRYLSLALADPEAVGEDWGTTYSFRADQLDMANARLGDKDSGDKDSDNFRLSSSCDILIPEALRLDPYGSARRRSLEKIVTSLKDLEDEFILAKPEDQARDLAQALGNGAAALAAKLAWSAHEKLAFAEALLASLAES